ncbi:hypothetical protein B7494_g2493 [Chlorociboria aeruginascens]|nr:hypothetical protein B7494_g2493 [Chlorociboria aeruginascens]
MSKSPALALDDDDLYEVTPRPSLPRRAASSHQVSLSPSPAVSSDKENRTSHSKADKGKGRMPMGPPPSKRKRVEGDTRREQNQRRRTTEIDEEDADDLDDFDAYDPDQDIEERRRVRKGLRDLTKNLVENRSEFLTPESIGLQQTLHKANEFSEQVRQTADATIDSRLLVTTADLSYKKTISLTTGDTAQGVDIIEFIAKCKRYIREGGGIPEQAQSNTQRRRRRDLDDDENDDDDMLNWDFLGRQVCLQHNLRPAVPGFLLGPLSTVKRSRKAIVRRAALRPNNLEETRPEVLRAGDISRDENANLTTICTQIQKRLEKIMADAEEAYDEDMTAEQEKELMERFGVSKTGGVALFKFVINPYSFGQTVENIFYVSFLIRDGKVGISDDEDGLPYLHTYDLNNVDDAAVKGVSKHQAVLAIDMETWEELITLFEIKEPLIPHRQEEGHNSVGAKGWYA